MSIRVLLIILTMVVLVMGSAQAEPLSQQDREEIARLLAAQGGSVEEVNPLIEQANRASARGLPEKPLVNKIKEGLAKGVEPKRIEPVLRELIGRFDTAQEILKVAGGRGSTEGGGGRGRALEVLAESLARGVTPAEVHEIERQVQAGRQQPTQEALASGAKGLALMKEARIPVQDSVPLVSEALRQGFQSTELVDLAREIKRRGRDFQEGTASLRAVREAIARGERPDRIFRDGPGDRSGRGGSERLDRGGERGERLRDDGGLRGERPERSGRSERPDRPERPDRSGSGR